MSFWTQCQDFIVKKIFRHECLPALDYYNTHIIDFALRRNQPGSIMLVGDSITEGWKNQFGMMPQEVINFGIAGDTTMGVYKRIFQIINAQPRTIIINIGVNDLNSGKEDDLYANYYEILKAFKRWLPEVKVFVCTMRYMNKLIGSDYAVRNVKVMKYNVALQELTGTFGFTWVDVNKFVAPEGILLDGFTEDGIHLTYNGYKAEWEGAIKDIVYNN